MGETVYELVSSWLPEDRKKRILQQMKKEISVPGFRKGKAPLSTILNFVSNKSDLQNSFLKNVCNDYFPRGSIILENPIDETLIKPDKNFPGIIARYYLDNQTVPENLNELASQYEQNFCSRSLSRKENQDMMQSKNIFPAKNPVSVKDTEPIKTEPSSPIQDKTGKTETSAAKPAEPGSSSPAAPDKLSTGSSVEEQVIAAPGKESSTEKEETSDFTEDTADTKDEHEAKQIYHDILLCYISKEENGGKVFYNFVPAAKFDADGFFHAFSDSGEGQGKINISSQEIANYYRRMQKRFPKDDICILRTKSNSLQENLKPNGDFCWVPYKIDIEDIDKDELLLPPEDFAYQYYQVYTVKNLQDYLSEGTQFRLPNSQGARILRPKIVLKDEDAGWMVGPFQTDIKLEKRGSTEKSWFVNPQTQSQYLYDVYAIEEGTNPMVCISTDNDSAEEHCLVKLSALSKTRRDFITDDILLKEIHKIMSTNGTNEPDFTQSQFCSLSLPDDIIRERMRRMEQVLERDLSLHEIADNFSGAISGILMRSLQTDMEKEEYEIVQKLALTPNFIKKFTDCQKVKDVVEKKQKELESAQETYQTKINQQHQKIAELDTKESEYRQTIEKYHLAGDISALIEQKTKLMTELKQLQDDKEKTISEHQNIKNQTEQLLCCFEDALKNPLKSAAEVVMHRRLYDALYASMVGDTSQPNQQLPAAAAPETAAVPEFLGQARLVHQLTESFHSYRPGFSDNDIINLYICLTQGFLTVFAGAPGTGKTSACRILAHSLGLDNDENPRFILVPVERGWGSKRDFIGYYNPLTKSFDQSNSQVYEALEISDAESERYNPKLIPPQIILLDEANLSQMEYYWSVFMNAADFSPRSALVDLGNGKTFRVSKALRFLATINNDNTTEALSPRLIDRAWIISLPTGDDFREVDFIDSLSLISMEELETYFGRKPGAVTTEDLDPLCRKILKDMYKLCQDLPLEVSERSKGAILQYCLTGCRRMLKQQNRGPEIIAVDYAISQKILPRLQGHGTDFRDNVLTKLKEFFRKNQLTKCEDSIDRILREGDENMNYYHFFTLGRS